MVHRFAKVLTSVGSEQDHPVIPHPVENFMAVIFSHGMAHCIDRRVACNKDALFLFAFAEKIVRALFGRSKMQITHRTHHLTVDLLRIWGVLVVCAEACFHMSRSSPGYRTPQARLQMSVVVSPWTSTISGFTCWITSCRPTSALVVMSASVCP